MKQITKREMYGLIVTELLDNASKGRSFINLNGVTLHYSSYNFTPIDDVDFSFGFTFNSEYVGSFRSYELDYFAMNGIKYEIVG